MPAICDSTWLSWPWSSAKYGTIVPPAIAIASSWPTDAPPMPTANVRTGGSCANKFAAPAGPSTGSAHSELSPPSVSSSTALGRAGSCSDGSPTSACSERPVLVSGNPLLHRYMILPSLVSPAPSRLPTPTVVFRKAWIAPAFAGASGTSIEPAEQPPKMHCEYDARPKRMSASNNVVT